MQAPRKFSSPMMPGREVPEFLVKKKEAKVTCLNFLHHIMRLNIYRSLGKLVLP